MIDWKQMLCSSWRDGNLKIWRHESFAIRSFSEEPCVLFLNQKSSIFGITQPILSIINCCFKLIIKLKIVRFSVNDLCPFGNPEIISYPIEWLFSSRSQKIVAQFYIQNKFNRWNGYSRPILKWNKYLLVRKQQPDNAQCTMKNQSSDFITYFIIIWCDGFIAKLIDNGQSCDLSNAIRCAFASDVYAELSN